MPSEKSNVIAMKVEIVQEKENKPLARREVNFRIEHIGDTTPSRADVHSKVVAHYDADPENVVISKIKTRFGVGITDGIARIYSDPDQMRRVELDYVLKRHGAEEE